MSDPTPTTAELDQDRDSFLAGRFDQRIRIAFQVAIPVHFVLILANGILDGRIVPTLAHATMAAMAWIIVRQSSDSIRTIIFSHVYWMFSFMTYAYALSHGQLATYGLGDASRAAMIALTSQAGLFLAFFLSSNAPVLTSERAREDGKRRLVFVKSQWLVLAVGLVGIAGSYFGFVPDSYSSALTGLVYVAMSIRLGASRINAATDPVVVGVLLVLFLLSASSNSRTDLLAIFVLLAFVAIVSLPRLFTLTNVLVGYLLWRLLSLFSSLTLSVRWARDKAVDMSALLFERLFSAETLWAIINPLHVHSAETAYVATRGAQRFYSEFLGGSVGILSMVTVLPQMDIATSRMSAPDETDWAELWNTLLSALPSFGQQKSLNFSDEVVWDLGLLSRGSIGRPMITAEGELFAIGGYPAVFVVIPICFLGLHLGYRMLAQLTGSRLAAILICSQIFIHTFISTTLLSLLVDAIRAPFQLLVVLGVLLYVARSRIAQPLGQQA